jgi:ribosome-associated protein YbcJ (S4-like RNA binding protein)
MRNPNDIIITGIPRSGTTLTCHLLNKLPGVVALHEPMHPPKFFGAPFDEIITEIKRFFDAQRDSILNNGTAISKSVSGAVPDNPVGKVDERTGKREVKINGRTILVTKPLGQDFKLAIKHPSMFTALIKPVDDNFPCFAIIRNPLSVLLSWNSVPYSQSNGHAPAAEAFDSNLSDSLKKEKNVYARQLILLDWFFSKYKSTLTYQQILRYEDIVATGGKALAVIAESANQLNEPLTSKNTNKLYNLENRYHFLDMLLNCNGSYFDFYDKKDIIRLL